MGQGKTAELRKGSCLSGAVMEEATGIESYLYGLSAGRVAVVRLLAKEEFLDAP